jgi:hypothetical protein
MIGRFVLFGLTAALSAGSGARAADDAVPAPDLARLCAAFGAGFHAIPGTDTCVRMGGRVRADAALVDGGDASRESHDFTTRSRGRVYLDTRTQTDLGLVRTYIELDAPVGPTD